MSNILLGNPWPLGSSITSRGVNFSLAAPKASRIDLLIFADKNDQHPQQIITLDKGNRSGDYWHTEIEGLGEGCIYSYKVFNQDPNNNEKIESDYILDPCARAIVGWDSYKRNINPSFKDKLQHTLKGVVCERDNFDFKSHPRPRHSWGETIIYELHVGGFTKNIEQYGKEKGTFTGLIQKIPYLKSIGVTAIELLPVFAFDSSDAPKGLRNFWGYSPLNWFTPHQEFVIGEDPLKARIQFREFVSACHDHDLEVILDVVYNHTTEGGSKGPLISWKGFGNNIYYHQDKDGDYQDVSGCGNTIAANRPLVRQLILESMRCWACELGVDGFRFDLGIALSRGENLSPLEKPPIFEEIESSPQLSDIKLISEPWDCGGLYKLGDFPAEKFRTWNGHFRDDIRRFWKGEKGSTWPIKSRLTGSSDVYNSNISHKKSINFITSHDGFTLQDTVSYNMKHNLANGESNRDGENHNNSWNNGLEGPTSNDDINQIRTKQKNNMLTSLILSPGIPMISMGDEVGRSQGGNNNVWCQDNNLGWMIWEKEDCDLDLKTFLTRLIEIRNKLPEFFAPDKIYQDKQSNKNKLNDEYWIQWHGIKLNQPDWGDWSHTISYSINHKDKGSAIWLGLNAYKETMKFDLPDSISTWEKIIDTSYKTKKAIKKRDLKNQSHIDLESRSFIMLLDKKFSNRIQLKVD